jgi:hypothetical protein
VVLTAYPDRGTDGPNDRLDHGALFFSTSFLTWRIWTVVLAPRAVIALIRLFRALAGLLMEPQSH